MSFTVRALHLHGHHVRPIDEPSPEAAAIAYLEDFAHDAEGDDLAVVVRDADTGREQCFRIDLATGETTPCAAGRTQ